MWTNFEKKASHDVYKVPALTPPSVSNKKNSGNSGSGPDKSAVKKERVVIIGAGPAGLACAIECHFLGFEVCVLEKRNYIERYESI
jgi:NADPH-dependent 2,4-dienoyl-CoA reductase/sulfur reductase-like enzyme